MCINAGLFGIQTVRYQNKKTNDAGTGLVLDQPRQSGIFLVWYRTVIIDARMPMPASVSWMPMPSYVNEYNKNTC
jgi:hypothetical protein